eukprot:8856570-Ditylum_brightwellii.AAC.1
MSMTLMQLPQEEDYWTKGKCGTIIYPAFKQWMSHGSFRFIKQYFCLSDYSLSVAAHKREKLWKARGAIIAVRDVCKRFMPRCCGVASINEARIPCNGRAPCVRVLKSKPVKRGCTLWCGVDFALEFRFDFHFDDNSLQASKCQHHAWDMTGETVLQIVREHTQLGVKDPPFANV